MNPTEVFVVRHGRTAANRTGTVQGQSDVPLDEFGLRQAGALAERLRGETFDAVYSSDLGRAAITARTIAPGYEIRLEKGLREWDLGAWVGKSVAEVRACYPEEWNGFLSDRPGLEITGGESRAAFYARAGFFLETVVRSHPGGRILVVSHCCVIRAMLRHVLGIAAPWARQPEIGNVSLSRFLCCDGVWQLGCWNDIAHLRQLASSPDGY